MRPERQRVRSMTSLSRATDVCLGIGISRRELVNPLGLHFIRLLTYYFAFLPCICVLVDCIFAEPPPLHLPSTKLTRKPLPTTRETTVQMPTFLYQLADLLHCHPFASCSRRVRPPSRVFASPS